MDWCNERTCSMADCAECDIFTEHRCLLPPPPPGPPPGPPTACTPATPNLNCIEHGGCCEEEGHTCFRKHGSGRRGYGRCLVECPQRDDWSCEEVHFPKPRPPPPPYDGPPCADIYQPCLQPPYACCGDKNGCHKRVGKQFSMCKPLRCTGDSCTCVDDENWLCPGWEKRLAPKPPPLPSPSPRAAEPPAPPSPSQPVPDTSAAALSSDTGLDPSPTPSPALVGVAVTFAVLAVLCSASIVWRCRRVRLRATRGVELREPREPKPQKWKRGGKTAVQQSEDACFASEEAGDRPDEGATPVRGRAVETATLNIPSLELD